MGKVVCNRDKRIRNVRFNDRELSFAEDIGTHEDDTRQVYISLDTDARGTGRMRDTTYQSGDIGVLQMEPMTLVIDFTLTVQKMRPRSEPDTGFPEVQGGFPQPKADHGSAWPESTLPGSPQPSYETERARRDAEEAKRHAEETSCYADCKKASLECSKVVGFFSGTMKDPGAERRNCDANQRACEARCR